MALSEEAASLDRLVTEARRADADYDLALDLGARRADERRGRVGPGRRGRGGGRARGGVDAIVARLARRRPARLRRRRLVRPHRGSSTRRSARQPSPPRPARSSRSSPATALSSRRARGGRGRRRGRARARSRSSPSPRPTPSSASARAAGTPYALGALEAAAAAGALTVALVSRAEDPSSPRSADHEIAVVVGPEFVAGSTRLKAGTAQKLVLNTISTVAMIRLGKTYGDLMVDVRASNEKLARPRAPDRAAGDRRSERARPSARSRTRTAARRSRSSRCSPGVDADAARARLERGRRQRASGARAMRLGVEAALVGGKLVPGDVEIADGADRRATASTGANGRGHRRRPASSTCR